MKNKNIILFLLLIITFGFALLPKYKDFQSHQKSIQKLNIQKNANINLLKELEEIKNTNNEKKEMLLESIPENLNQEEIIQDIIDITQKSGFIFQQIRFTQNIMSTDDYNIVIASLSVEGDSSKIEKLLTMIESNKRFLSLKDISIQRRPKTSPEHVLLQLDISAYSL